MRNVHKKLQLKEVKPLLLNPTMWITDHRHMAGAKSGEVFYFRARSLKDADNWRGSGHLMKQQGGVPDASKRTPQFSMIDRRVAYIETEAQPKGDKRFMRISWTNSNNKLDTLIQFVGMDELSVPLVHRNSKNNTRPRNPLAPGLLRDMEQSPLKARALNEQMTRAAGPQLVNQQLGTPRNDHQIRQLQYLHRKRSITEDQYLRLFKLSCEYPT